MNIHLDTPTEILHTILLGVVKYFWGQTIFSLEKSKSLGILQARMEALAIQGLNLPSFTPEYICHYRRSLIGKHFKSLAQVMPFLIYDLVPSSVLDGWTVIGELVMLLWHTQIDDCEQYLVSGSLTLCNRIEVNMSLGDTITNHSGLPKHHRTVLAQYSHFETQVSFSHPPADLHSSLRASNSLLNRTL